MTAGRPDDGEQPATRHASVLAALAGAVADASRAEADEVAARLRPITSLTRFGAGDVLVEQHAVATDLHVLVEGSITYTHAVDEDLHETVTIDQLPWIPIGWSGLNLRRHRVTATAASDGLLLSLPFAAFDELARSSTGVWAALIEFALRTAAPSLWRVRGVPLPATDVPAPLDELTATSMAPSEVREMYDQSASLGALPPACRAWLAEHTHVHIAEPGTTVVHEGQPSDGLWLLYNGRVRMTFDLASEDDAIDVRTREAVRSAVRPGTLLAITGPTRGIPAPFDVTTTRVTRLAHVSQSAMADLHEQQPAWAGALLGQELWQLRNWLTWTRSRFGTDPEQDGIASVEHLVADSSPTLPVNSSLYGVPYLLRNRLTREDGFRRLYSAHIHGRSAERAVASTALDLLRDLERGHRFFAGLQSTYDAVIASGALPPRERRRVANRHFRDALHHVPYVIEGLDNLPDDPNFILVYNHMAYAPDSVLPNGFLFNPDSHFISSILLEPTYGDGLRVARMNAATEFWRADYYDRLGHIPVATPESGWIEETPEEKAARKQQFLDDCAAVLASGQPFSIAPEGTITQEDSATARSPGPFKPGAFLMSEQLPSRPRILPVALANFDGPAHSAVFSCVVKPPFSMAERDVDVTDPAAMDAFLDDYRREFRTHVEEAIALAEDAVRPDAELGGVVTNLGAVDVVHEEFEHDVRALELRPAPPSPDARATVFYGSSTFRLWRRLGDDVGVPRAVNLAFGGSTLDACRLYFERLVVPHRPERLVLYAGDNDLGRGESVEHVIDLFGQFADLVQTQCPTARCWFVSIKPSPIREGFSEAIRSANRAVAATIDQRDQWSYVDWYPHLVDDEGRADPALFEPDGLHVNAEAYARLARLLREELRETPPTLTLE